MTISTLTGPSSWSEMQADIRKLFERDTIDIDVLKKVMENYESNENEWGPYAYFDPYRYTRNLIDKGNGKYNLMLLCWGPNMSSSIHDHSNSHCFVKVLQGRLSEELYHVVNDFDEAKMYQTGHNVYVKNQVSYINDTIGVHRMSNQDSTSTTVTLHLYCPPFESCHTFDENSGKINTCNVTFFSQYGTRIGTNIGPDMDRINQNPVGVTPSFIATK
ncbi:unnamed protein product [Gordionus sp. m RMFG-2023]|uniref:cysteine dioxygenase 1-like n=1 Tax=Gordionus sp. m RMFG-2023 TaxID=3053472 RepID=UPI0030DE362B